MTSARIEKRLAVVAFFSSVIACGESPHEVAPAYASIDDLPECNPEQPTFECLKRLFLPLRGTHWPFASRAVSAAYERGSTQVLPGWALTALHVIDANAPPGQPANCYAPDFEFAVAGEPIELADCGRFLFLGGHRQAMACKAAGESLLTCVDKVPVAETFDIGLTAAAPRAGSLEVRTDVRVGERVFLVGDPAFLFYLDDEQVNWFSERYPVVSSGRVLELDDRGMVISNLAFSGNSGGPVLDDAGRIVGIAYSKIGYLRSEGTPTHRELPNHRTLAVRIDERMKAGIDSE